MKTCAECGKQFSIREGGGLGESYLKPGAMLPSTRYICLQCYEKLKEKNMEKKNE